MTGIATDPAEPWVADDFPDHPGLTKVGVGCYTVSSRAGGRLGLVVRPYWTAECDRTCDGLTTHSTKEAAEAELRKHWVDVHGWQEPTATGAVLELLGQVEAENVTWRHKSNGISYRLWRTEYDYTLCTRVAKQAADAGLIKRFHNPTRGSNGGGVELTGAGRDVLRGAADAMR